MYSVISVSSKSEHQQTIKGVILANPDQYMLKGQFSICIDVLSIAPELKPDIVIVEEKMYFVGIRDFIRILTENGVHAVYILLKDNSFDMVEYKNSRICARLDENNLTENLLLDALHSAEAKLQHQMNEIFPGDIYKNHDYHSQMEENQLFARIIGGQLTEDDYHSPILQCTKGYLIIARLSSSKNKSFVSYQNIEQMKQLQQALKLYLEIYNGGNIFAIQLNELCIWFDLPSDNHTQPMTIIRTIGKQIQRESYQKGCGQCLLQCTDKKIMLKELPAQYRTLDKLVRYHFFVNPDVIISESYLQNNTVETSYQEIQEELEALEHSYKDLNSDELLNNVDRLFQIATQCLSYNTYLYIWNQLVFWYNLKIKENHLSIDTYAFTLDTNAFSDIQDAKREMKQVLQNILDAIARKKSSYNPYVEKAIAYLKENISEDVSLTTMADLLHVNSAYLSSLFRQETQKTFVQIRSEIKIERAKELLKERKKIYEVAQAVGFENEKYFSQAFKRITGKTPRGFQIGEDEYEKR